MNANIDLGVDWDRQLMLIVSDDPRYNPDNENCRYTIEEALKNGASHNATDGQGLSAAFYAVYNELYKYAETLRDLGADMGFVQDKKNTISVEKKDAYNDYIHKNGSGVKDPSPVGI